MSQRLSRVVFATPVQDPSAAGQFERRDFNKNNAKLVTIERALDGTVTLTAPDGSEVLVSGIPYWCNLAKELPVALAPPLPPPPEPPVPPVTQSQAHPRDRLYRGGKK